ncbi:MAG: CHASE2 domain-containing protein [Merismopedia sp. SIO2A8]|nr:CHASE2 domain-containing protein [Merismopedia sp. SIO2A8]
MTHKYQDKTELLNTDTPTRLLPQKTNAKPPGRQKEGKRKSRQKDGQQRNRQEQKITRSPITSSPGGRSRFRPTYLSSLTLSALKSRLWLHDGQSGPLRRMGHGAMLVSAIAAAGVTALDFSWVQVLERESQTFFFQRRGTVLPPQNIVIVEMDEASLSAFAAAEQGYRDEPERYLPLVPIAQWPWQRSAYGIATDRLIQAGAKVVAVDVIIDQPSTWGDWDDLALQQTLQQSPGQAVLASSFNHEQQDTGGLLSGIHPLSSLTDAGAMSGYINYPVEPNGRIHRFSRTWLQLQIANDPVISHHLKKLDPAFHHSFVQQTVAIAQSPATQSLSTQSLSTQPLTTAQSSEQPSVDNPQEGENLSAIAEYDVIANNTHQQRNQQIFFYGPTGETFEYESFWELLDPQTWKQHQQQQTFQDKIVLIGPTAQLFQDFHRTPFGQMPGVEVHANAIATYLEGRTINAALPHPHVRGIFVLIFTLGIGYGIGYPRRLLHRTAITIGAVGAWALLSYLGWLFLSLTFPIAVPMGALISIGMGYVVTGLVQGKIKLRGALKRYVSSPIVQDIINQQDDLQDLISEKEKESIGKRLDGRYEITSLLGAGGFGQTFVARDLHRPGSPQCVVKQLHPVTNDPQVFELSRR